MTSVLSPLTFEPVFMERIWGGHRLASLFGKKTPPTATIGESWEIVDRPEAQSVVRNGPFRDRTLHELWSRDRKTIFGDLPDSPRFPLLIKLLDAHDRLSLQVHPPEKIAATLGGEAKTEFWYVASAIPGAKLYVGLRKEVTSDQFAEAVRTGAVAELVHSFEVKTGDSMFLPSGRFHAIGAGNVLVEIQQNSDTTYRVYDWNRTDDTGKARQLHVEQALKSIDFNDITPNLTGPDGELLVQNDLFEIQKWTLGGPRVVAPVGQFAIICCLTGALRCVDVDLRPGEFALVPATLADRKVQPREDGTTLLRVTIPKTTP
ncbi:MAG TPA: type I phosphomannose isomerase catalytic subunit [Chthoniobacterales bacterium]|nr:type I phosphomannose isomerase catalytic subunit [Chthoniobacterales bacterium]